MIRISEGLSEKIKDSTDIVSLISSYVELKKTGRGYTGLCPFHSEKTPSFSVNEERQYFHCFGCGESGDAITFVMKMENLSFVDSVKLLAERAGIQIEDTSLEDVGEKRRKRLYEVNFLAARFYYENLKKNKRAQAYLDGRGLSESTQKLFGLGYAEDAWDSLTVAMKGKATEEELVSLGLIKKSKTGSFYDTFRNRIVFPIIDVKNRVIGFGARAMGDDKPKYLNSPESEIFSKGHNLYGLNLVKKYSDRKAIFLVEGYMDVISLFQKGIPMAVASLGTALTEKQAKTVSRFGSKIYISYDSDQAGVKATLRAIDIFYDAGETPQIISMGDAKDPDEFFKSHSKEDFFKLTEKSKTPYVYRMDFLRSKYDITSPEEKMKLIREFLNMTRTIKNPLQREVLYQKFSEDLNLSHEVMKSVIKDYKPVGNENISLPPIRKKVIDFWEFQLVKLCAIAPEIFERIRGECPDFVFQNQEFGNIHQAIESIRQKNGDIERAKLYELVLKENPSYSDRLKQIFFVNEDFFNEEMEESLSEYIKMEERKRLKRERAELLSKLKASECSVELLSELARINRILKMT